MGRMNERAGLERRDGGMEEREIDQTNRGQKIKKKKRREQKSKDNEKKRKRKGA